MGDVTMATWMEVAWGEGGGGGIGEEGSEQNHEHSGSVFLFLFFLNTGIGPRVAGQLVHSVVSVNSGIRIQNTQEIKRTLFLIGRNRTKRAN